MTKKGKSVTFKSVEEYRAYYASDPAKSPAKGSKYYRIGGDIAKLACDKAINKLQRNETK